MYRFISAPMLYNTHQIPEVYLTAADHKLLEHAYVRLFIEFKTTPDWLK